MKIRTGRVASLAYRATTEDGRIVDQVLSDEPLLHVQGSGKLRPEIEEQLENQRDAMQKVIDAFFALPDGRTADRKATIIWLRECSARLNQTGSVDDSWLAFILQAGATALENLEVDGA